MYNPQSLYELFQYKLYQKQSGNNIPIDLLLGGTMAEEHIQKHFIDSPNLVYCLDTIRPSPEFEFNYIEFDFNSVDDWHDLLHNFENSISNIYFDSSTTKFMKPFWDLQNKRGIFARIKRLLHSQGNIFIGPLDTGSQSLDFRELSVKINYIPLVWNEGAELYFDNIKELNAFITDKSPLGKARKFDVTEAYRNYVTRVIRGGKELGFNVQIYDEHQMRYYPIQNTTYPIRNFFVFTKL